MNGSQTNIGSLGDCVSLLNNFSIGGSQQKGMLIPSTSAPWINSNLKALAGGLKKNAFMTWDRRSLEGFKCI